jgi:hypothetical protein
MRKKILWIFSINYYRPDIIANLRKEGTYEPQEGPGDGAANAVSNGL